jgi:hypothetical protein
MKANEGVALDTVSVVEEVLQIESKYKDAFGDLPFKI